MGAEREDLCGTATRSTPYACDTVNVSFTSILEVGVAELHESTFWRQGFAFAGESLSNMCLEVSIWKKYYR